MEPIKDFTPAELEAIADEACPFCGVFEDDAPEPMTASERVFLVAGYLASAMLVCLGLVHLAGWVFA
jgi:hypothetical protein